MQDFVFQALRVSMEEQRARQEAEARKAASETPGGENAERQTGGMTPKFMVIALSLFGAIRPKKLV